MFISVNPGHLANACAPIYVTVDGNVKLVNCGQFANAFALMIVSADGIIKLTNCVQLINALSLIVVIDDGIETILVNVVLSVNAVVGTVVGSPLNVIVDIPVFSSYD